jgi:DNA-binding beta-propeller fold protein YncE
MRRALLAILILAASAAAARAQGVVFVLNSGAASISVVDMAARKEVRRIPALREPHHLVLSPDKRSLLVGDTAANEMLFLDPATGALQKRIPMSDPYQFGWSPDGQRFVAAALARNQIDVYDGKTFALVKRFQVATTPSHLDFSPDSATVFVSLQDSDKLVAIDLRGLAVKWTEAVGKTPAGVIWHDGHVLVACMGADFVAQVDPADGRVVRRIVTGKGAHTVFRSPLDKTLWVNNRAAGTTVQLDPKTLAIGRTFKLGGGPDDIDFAPDGKLWITKRWAEKVAILDPATGAVEDVKIGRSPHGLFVNARVPAPR